MNWKYAFFILLIAFVIYNCGTTKETVAEDRVRMMQPNDISSFHPEMTIKLGWVPYQNQKLVQNGRNEWKVVKEAEDQKEGKVPVLLVSHPSIGDSILLDMNIKNEILGKLIKHSAITMQPITRPFTEYFENAKCQNCHPEDVKVDFNR